MVEKEDILSADINDDSDESVQIANEDDVKELSDEELDEVADSAIEIIREILHHFDISGAEINEYEGDEGEIILDIVGSDDLAILIGRRGRNLDALQTMVSTINYRKLGFRFPVTVDVESYKHRQRQKLESLAHSAARRALSQDKDVSLRPMTPYERRLVHMALRDNEKVETFSEGMDPNRHIVVRPL